MNMYVIQPNLSLGSWKVRSVFIISIVVYSVKRRVVPLTSKFQKRDQKKLDKSTDTLIGISDNSFLPIRTVRPFESFSHVPTSPEHRLTEKSCVKKCIHKVDTDEWVKEKI